MYKIIGADQKQYGPVTSDQIRQWIADGRVNGQTQAQAAGTEEWKPLAAFPEFADVFGAPAAAPPSLGQATFETSGAREAALQAVKGPGIALVVTSILNILLALWGLFQLAFMHPGSQPYPGMERMDAQAQKIMEQWMRLATGPVGMASDAVGLAISVVVLVGALKMQSLRNYSLAIIASILAMLPCATPCCLIGLPFGIWALVVLNKPGVKSHFT